MKVLWIDDEYETLELIKESASDNDIELIGFKSAELAIKELERPENYDAVLLDGLFYLGNDENGTPSNDTAFGKVARKLITLKDNGIILPWFILSGKIRFTLDQNSMVETFADKDFANGIVFNKTKVEDKNLLWIEIKKAVTEIPTYKLKQEYRQVFEVCSEKYIGVDSQKYLLQILSSIKKPNFNFDDELYFTQLRIILELMFRASNKYGLLHDVCISNGKVNLSESSLFLSGAETKHLNVFSSVSHFPKLISDAVKSIIFITGAASHTSDGNPQKNINLEDYRKTVKSPYLLYSLTFQLLDILIWFKEYIDKNNDVILNKSYWQTTLLESINSSEGWIEGKVSRIADNGYGTFLSNFGGEKLSIVPNLVTELNLNVNDIIRVTTKHDKSGTKVFIDLIEKI